MELRHLRYFTVVAEELHFGRAAARLNMSQPPLSQQIRNLETEIGAQLLNRGNRRVTLTSAGSAFLRRARAILNDAENAAAEAGRIAAGLESTISIGYMSAAMLDQFVPILHHFRKEFPAANVQLRQMASPDQLKALLVGKLDLAFVDVPPKGGALQVNDQLVAAETAWREAFVAALPNWHRLANRPRLSLAELADDEFVLPPREPASGFYDQVIALCQKTGFSPNVVRQADVLPVTVSLVAAGYGVSVVPACVCQPWAGLARFVELDTDASIGVTLAWRPDDATGPIEALRRTVQEMAPDLINTAMDRAAHLNA